MSGRGGFLPGMVAGAVIALVAMVLIAPPPSADAQGARLVDWIALNLGSSSWLFAAVLVLFIFHVLRLRRLLEAPSERRAVVELDQLTDVWIHVFIGIGVIWTAVGMRAALQVTLANPDQALTDSAGSVLKKLVDGGILLALSTTIVGAVGGYLLRLAKTLYVGAALHDFYDGEQRSDMRELLAAVQRIEVAVNGAPADRDRSDSGASERAHRLREVENADAAR